MPKKDKSNDHSKRGKTTRRKVQRNFLTISDKYFIQSYASKGMSPSQIAKYINSNYRQVRDYLHRLTKNQINTFTEEEDQLIIDLYSSGVTKESLIAKQMPNKAPWMIRNRIKYLKKKDHLPIQNEDVENIMDINFDNSFDNILMLDEFSNFQLDSFEFGLND